MSGNGQYDGDKTRIDAMLEPVYTRGQSTLRQLSDDASDTVLIENNAVTRK